MGILPTSLTSYTYVENTVLAIHLLTSRLQYKALLAMTDQELPQVISNSYGDDEQSVPPKYAANVCNLIGAMGLRGITILESSGDDGVGSACITNTGKPKLTFNPIFPATCPYITAVGGTMGIPEIAWIGSSGG